MVSTHPNCLRLQVRSISFKIINSTTKLLPAWKVLCAKHSLAENLLPRDVGTRWNSTYDMLALTLKYRKVVKDICGDMKMGLRTLELTAREWTIVKQLMQVLKVRVLPELCLKGRTLTLTFTCRLHHLRFLLSRSSKMPPTSSLEARLT